MVSCQIVFIFVTLNVIKIIIIIIIVIIIIIIINIIIIIIIIIISITYFLNNAQHCAQKNIIVRVCLGIVYSHHTVHGSWKRHVNDKNLAKRL